MVCMPACSVVHALLESASRNIVVFNMPCKADASKCVQGMMHTWACSASSRAVCFCANMRIVSAGGTMHTCNVFTNVKSVCCCSRCGEQNHTPRRDVLCYPTTQRSSPAVGPMKAMPLSSHSAENSVDSLRKPYPGKTASQPANRWRACGADRGGRAEAGVVCASCHRFGVGIEARLVTCCAPGAALHCMPARALTRLLGNLNQAVGVEVLLG